MNKYIIQKTDGGEFVVKAANYNDALETAKRYCEAEDISGVVPTDDDVVAVNERSGFPNARTVFVQSGVYAIG